MNVRTLFQGTKILYPKVVNERNISYYTEERLARVKARYKSDCQYVDCQNAILTLLDDPELRTQFGYTATIGKVVKKAFPNKTDAEVAELAAQIAALYIRENTGFSTGIVSGEYVRKWYLETNCNNLSTNTPLHNSCMKHKCCQPFLDLYVKSPNIGLAIVINDDNLLEARAIVYIKEKLYSRIYYNHVNHVTLLRNMLLEKGYSDLCTIKDKAITIPLGVAFNSLEYMPYIDAVPYIESGYGEIVLRNEPSTSDYLLANNTNGTVYAYGKYKCGWCGNTCFGILVIKNKLYCPTCYNKMFFMCACCDAVKPIEEKDVKASELVHQPICKECAKHVTMRCKKCGKLCSIRTTINGLYTECCAYQYDMCSTGSLSFPTSSGGL